MIKTNDITVVVQGLVGVHTKRCLASIRKYLPRSTIVLSTWKGSNVMGLEFDEVIFNDDPGGYPYERGKKRLNNVNRQIVSTLAGIRIARTKYVLKFRTDFILKGRKFLKYFDRYAAFNSHLKILEKRVLSCSIYARDPSNDSCPYAFHPSDFIFFGLKEDVLNIWDIPLMSKNEAGWFVDKEIEMPQHCLQLIRYFPEQYIWVNFLRKYADIRFENFLDRCQEVIDITRLSFVNNLVILSMQQLNIEPLKKGLLDSAPETCFTYIEWLKMYKQLCDANTRVPKLDFEKVKYLGIKCVFLSWAKSQFPLLYRIYTRLKSNRQAKRINPQH